MLTVAFNWLYESSKKLPQISNPKGILSSKQKLMWTIGVLLVYFILYNTTAIGVKQYGGGVLKEILSIILSGDFSKYGQIFSLLMKESSSYDIVQILTASRQGSLLALGIGPIVMASIFIQLFAGGGLLNIDMNSPEARKKILGAQTTLAILVALLEGFAISTSYASNGLLTLPGTIGFITVLVQLVLGAAIVIYLDQLVSKYGIGSGIGLFIAAGVSFSVIVGALATLFGPSGIVTMVSESGIEGLSNAFIQFLPFITTMVVFWVVVYGESAKVKLPLSVPGAHKPLELPFFFVSNLPVIFAAALLINVMLISNGMMTHMSSSGKADFVNYIGELLYLTTPIHAYGNIPDYINKMTQGRTQFLGIPEWVHAIVYLITLSLLSIFFGKFWVEMSPQQNPDELAEVLAQQNISIKGHRTDKRFLKMKLAQYIWPLTVTGSLAVGLLAGFANLLGAYGTGTGILLTVEILYRMMNEIKQTLDVHYPKVSRILFGGDL